MVVYFYERIGFLEIFYTVMLLIIATVVANMVYPHFPLVPQAFYQIFAGMILSLLPIYSHFTLEPEMFMLIIIAPLMFHDGQNIDTHELRKHMSSTLSMSVLLAIITVTIMGYISHAIIPSIPLALTFALAAIVTPTDNVAVSSITSNVEMPHNVMGMLERESLFNDASGLVAFSLALNAFTTGEFSVGTGIKSFLFVFLGGLIIGLMLGIILIWSRIRLVRNRMDSTSVIVPFDIISPFAIYLIAEHFGFSGILAVVAAGVLRSAFSKQIRLSNTSLQLVSKSTWNIVTDILNGFVFVLLGVSIPTVWHDIQKESMAALPKYLVLSIILYVVMVVLRYLWVKFSFANIQSKANDHNKNAIISALSGIHGTITLSMAFSIPFTLGNAPFPYRTIIVFMATVIIILSLLVPAIVLPMMLPSNKSDIDPNAIKDQKRKTVNYATKKVIDNNPQQKTDAHIVAATLSSQYSSGRPSDKRFRKIMKAANEVEINSIQTLVDTNKINAKIANYYIRRLVWQAQRNRQFSFYIIVFAIKHFNHLIIRKFKKQPHKKVQYDNQRKLFKQMESYGYENVMQFLSKDHNAEDQAAVNAARHSYNFRHKRLNDNGSSERQNELFIQAFQYEYNYIQEKSTLGNMSQLIAEELYKQVSIDQLIYMQQSNDGREK